MGKLNVMNLEDLMLASITMFVLDNISKRAMFYNKSLSFKEYAYQNLSKDYVELNKDEYFGFDVVGDYFEKVSENYVDDYQGIDKTTVILKLTRQFRNDFKEFVKKHNADTGSNKIAFGAFKK